MERHTMFLDGKTQCCQDVSSPQSNGYIQCASNQNGKGIFIEFDKLILKLNWEKIYKRIEYQYNKIHIT